MDQVTQVKTDFRLNQWKQLIADRQASSLSVRAWCKQNKVCEGSYYYYLKRLRMEACSQLPAQVHKQEQTVTFQKLEVKTPVANTQAAIIIHLPAASIEVEDGTSQQTIEAVLLALKNIC